MNTLSKKLINFPNWFKRGSIISAGCKSTEESFIEFSDEYEHLDPLVEYIFENILYEPKDCEEIQIRREFEILKDLNNSILSNACTSTCGTTILNCCSISCDATAKNCSHGCNYVPSKDGNELVLNEKRPCKDLIYECMELCPCRSTCTNRLVQYGPRKNLKIQNTGNPHKLNGLYTEEFIPKGGFICEYAGEILTRTEAEKRILQNQKENRMNYVICLNEYPSDAENIGSQKYLQTFIDPVVRGNIGRYLNHSCDPNCNIIIVRVNSVIPKLGIFANRDVDVNEELTFHYGFKTDSLQGSNEISSYSEFPLKPCYCGASNCQKYLPNLEF